MSFRAATCACALELGLCGHVANRRDGGVEVVAGGNAAALDALDRWLHHGPPAARVANVVRQPLPEQALGAFAIR